MKHPNACKNERTVDEFKNHIINLYDNFIKKDVSKNGKSGN